MHSDTFRGGGDINSLVVAKLMKISHWEVDKMSSCFVDKKKSSCAILAWVHISPPPPLGRSHPKFPERCQPVHVSKIWSGLVGSFSQTIAFLGPKSHYNMSFQPTISTQCVHDIYAASSGFLLWHKKSSVWHGLCCNLKGWLFFIRFWYLRCCGCPWNRGRPHLAMPLKTCHEYWSRVLTGWLLCLSPNSEVTASETPPFPHLGCVPAVVPAKGGSSA